MNAYPIEAVAGLRVLVVGDVMLDRYWFGEVDRISPEAPVPVVRVARREDRLGGAANVARNVITLGGQATLVGLIGHDEAGKSIQRLAENAGIAVALIDDLAMHTTLKMRVLGRQQQLLRVDFEESPSADVLACLTQIVIDALPRHDVLVLSDYAKGVLTYVERLITAAREHKVPVFVDPKGDDYNRYCGATLVTPNRAEMCLAVGRWTDEAQLAQRAEALRSQLKIEALLVTRSEQGMTLFTETGSDHVDAQAHEVFDVSGAGDTVLATLAVTRGAGLSWVDAMRWANRAGGIAVGKLGTSTVTFQELLGDAT
jgi:rfaE bifunctional protein kinase chain/domain